MLGPDIALSTLDSCHYLHQPKTRFPVRWLPLLPGRELHPLKTPSLPGVPMDFRKSTGLLYARIRRTSEVNHIPLPPQP